MNSTTNSSIITKKKSRRELDALPLRPMPRGYVFDHFRPGDTEQAYTLMVEEIGGKLASIETLSRVIECRPDLTFVFRNARDQGIAGFSSFLLLSEAGLDAVSQDRFEGTNPARAHLAGPQEAGAALYCWASVAMRLGVFAIPHIMECLKAPAYAALDVYSRAGTTGGANLMKNLGYEPLTPGGDGAVGGLWVYRRLVGREKQRAA